MGVSGLSQPAAVFLDRDGVINRNVMNPLTQAWEAPLTVENFVLANNALLALRALRKAGFLLFVVSNQPNYAKAKASFETLENIHHHLLHLLHEEQIEFAAFYYCLHHPHGVRPGHSGPCRCRKPSPFFSFKRVTSSVWTWSAPGWSVIVPVTLDAAKRRACIRSTYATRKRVLPATKPERSFRSTAWKLPL